MGPQEIKEILHKVDVGLDVLGKGTLTVALSKMMEGHSCGVTVEHKSVRHPANPGPFVGSLVEMIKNALHENSVLTGIPLVASSKE